MSLLVTSGLLGVNGYFQCNLTRSLVSAVVCPLNIYDASAISEAPLPVSSFEWLRSMICILQELEFALQIFNFFFTSVFILEAAVKIIALGLMRYLSDRYTLCTFCSLSAVTSQDSSKNYMYISLHPLNSVLATIITSSVRGAKYCDCDQRFCLSVCLCSVCSLECLKNHMSKLHEIFCACYLWPWLGLRLIVWRQYDTLCTSGFVN